jgi:contactin associated protein-like 2
VDNYETQEYNFNIKESADAQFNNIQYMYIGRNESMNEGFVGCVSRVEFDDIYPLKLLFQQDPPPNVRSIGGDINVFKPVLISRIGFYKPVYINLTIL